MPAAGRWCVPAAPREDDDTHTREQTEHVARTLLQRYGVVFWKLLEREAAWLPSWRELRQVYQRLEARGEIRGGRFVEGLVGEQFALPEAIPALRAVQKRPLDGQHVIVNGCDPLNLVGTTLAGDRLPAVATTRILFEDGIAVAAKVAGKLQWLVEGDAEQQSRWRRRLSINGPASRAWAHGISDDVHRSLLGFIGDMAGGISKGIQPLHNGPGVFGFLRCRATKPVFAARTPGTKRAAPLDAYTRAAGSGALSCRINVVVSVW